MKIKARIITALLAIIMVAGIFTSCNNGEAGETTRATSEQSTAVETENPFHIEDQDYEGYEFYALIVGFTGAVNEFAYNETDPTIIDNAIYNRNVAVEDKLGIVIKNEYKKAGSTTASNEGFGTLKKEYTSGSTTYDTYIVPAYDVSPAAYQGYCYDLNSVEQLDLTANYWDQNAVQSLEVKEMLFYITGDFSLDTFDSTECIAFNKTIAETQNITDLYTLVEEGKWTFEKWKEYTSLISEDLDGDGYYTEKDSYGSVIWDDAIYAVVHSTGERCCTLDEYGDLVLGLGTERVVTAFQSFVEFAKSNSCLRFQQNFGPNGARSDNSNSGHLTPMFTNNQCLFVLTTVGTITGFRDMNTDYGILPYFKFDENQDRYYNTVSPFNARFLCLPFNLADVERTGNIIETIAYFSTKYITDAYYEKTLVGQTIRDDESLPMLKLLRETRVYDLGYYYQPANINKNLIYNFRAFDPNWMSKYEKLKTAAETNLATINKSFDKLSEQWQ